MHTQIHTQKKISNCAKIKILYKNQQKYHPKRRAMDRHIRKKKQTPSCLIYYIYHNEKMLKVLAFKNTTTKIQQTNKKFGLTYE